MTEPFIIPSLNTERLLLRAFEKDDLDPFATMVSPCFMKLPDPTEPLMQKPKN